MKKNPEERFWSHVDQSGDCWLWTGGVTEGGYGQFRLGKKVVYVHRYSYALANGPIPPGLEIDHRPTCPKRCVRDGHLRAATHKQNMENRAGSQSNNASSGVRGVYWEKRWGGKWVARVKHHGVYHYNGSYQDLADAEAAANEHRKRLFTHNDMDRDIA